MPPQDLQALIASGGDLQVHLFQNRLEIVNPGGLVGGLTVDTLGTRSIPRNPLLFGMMQRMDLVEKFGSGFKRIREHCDKQNCQHQEIQADKDWFRVIFRRKNAVSVGASPLGNGLDKAHDEAHDQAYDEAYDEAPVGEQVTGQVEEEAPVEAPVEISATETSIITALAVESLGRSALLARLGYSQRTGNFKKAIRNLLDNRWIELTIPDKPNSRLQKYRLTTKGTALLEKVKHG